MGCAWSKAGSRYAASVGGEEGDAYTDGRGGSSSGGGGYALPTMHAGEGVSGICSGGPGVIITGGQDGSAAMWRWSGRKTTGEVENNNHRGGGGDAGDLIHRWAAHPKPVTRVAHLPGAGRVLTACRDGLVRAWSPGDTATPAAEMKGHTLTVSGLDAMEAGKKFSTPDAFS